MGREDRGKEVEKENEKKEKRNREMGERWREQVGNLVYNHTSSMHLISYRKEG